MSGPHGKDKRKTCEFLPLASQIVNVRRPSLIGQRRIADDLKLVPAEIVRQRAALQIAVLPELVTLCDLSRFGIYRGVLDVDDGAAVEAGLELGEVRARLLAKKWAREDELKKIDASVRATVNEASEFATHDSEPDPSELYTDVYR